jgi:hypothetical protein
MQLRFVTPYLMWILLPRPMYVVYLVVHRVTHPRIIDIRWVPPITRTRTLAGASANRAVNAGETPHISSLAIRFVFN